MEFLRPFRPFRRSHPYFDSGGTPRPRFTLHHPDTEQESRNVEQNLQIEARTADLLMIWTDCDREGEHIGSEIMTACRKVKPGLKVKRARFSAIIPA